MPKPQTDTPRFRAFLALIGAIAVGYVLKFYRGFGQEFINNLGPASIVYECILMLGVYLLFPRRRYAFRIAAAVCAFTVALEFLQLWKPPWLQSVRGTVLGAAFFGDTFSWWDLPAYPIGCAVGYGLLLWIGNE